MANEIIETYKLMEERIKSENAKIFFEMLDSPFPAFKAKAINELMKQKIDSPIIKEYLDDSDAEVRFSALKHMEKLGTIDEEETKKALKDLSASIRKEALIIFTSYGFEPMEFILDYVKDPDPTVRYQLLTSVLEFYPEDSEKLIELMKEDPYQKIQHLIYALENIGETLISETIEMSVKKIALSRYYEKNDSMTFFNVLKNNYYNCDKKTKLLIIKFLAGLPCDIIKEFMEKELSDEKDDEILMQITRTIKKVCGNDLIPSWIVDAFINKDEPKYIKYGLKLATDKDDMAYVDFSRGLLDKIDDDYVIGAADYLVFFQDYKLSDYVPDFLNSLSTKRILTGLKIIKKLKLENYLSEISDISMNKKYPISVRRSAINLLKYFKAKQYWEIPYNILKDPTEKGRLKLAALNALLRLNAEMVTDL
ncbi:HEAT repeat domain-containing protein [Oceanotoga sp. DSM 15011]|jgi:hypothetical protein|uniref:HEAT repeat protein n=1 Tax=Oceanotoga teriensis TaxID=515440 RepID=A0AA45HIZ1_9BACT|nr:MULTISPECIES: HEAT repeat domain-containing protein [Oceanotoga]MDN5343189.1 hypothetical protein [Oceanotoga sp.]MDO7976259.1 HEAT repeat domain-containing protein [Oceanotoga teriensis]PWJ95456.1 hypothetical protein C7380_10586 [Oceanotoga teriensis]UYP01095.1 HEAT repeat domain-containing protein [Oceanotoga sp. DSM 15011]